VPCPATLFLPERHPSVVVSPGLDVVHANRRWAALHAPLRENRNIARMVFLDPLAARFFVHRRHEQADVVAALNEAGHDRQQREEIAALADELATGNQDFRRLRDGPPLRPLRLDRYVVRHPQLGLLHFVRRSHNAGPYLVRVCVPSSETAHSLTLLDLL
jgi:hypothetical protein